MLYRFFLASLILAAACKKGNESPTPPPDNTAPLKTDSAHLNLSGNKNSNDSFNVIYAKSWKISVDPSTATWCNVNLTSGTGNKKIYVTVAEDNLTPAMRTAKIMITPDGDTSNAVQIEVSQPKYSSVTSARLFGGSALDELHGIIRSSDGGYVAVGKSASNDGDLQGFKGGNTDVWIVKYDQNDNIVWEKAYGGFDADGGNSIINTSDGGYMVAGFETYGGDSVTNDHGQGDGWLLKLDAAGNKIWDKAIGGSSLDVIESVVQTADGGYVVAGNTLSNDGDATGNHGNFDAWVVRLDENGAIIWEKEFGGSDADYFHSVAAATDGGFLLAGETSSSDGDVAGHHSGKDGWIVKIDANGNKSWQKDVGGSDYDIIYSVVPSDNNFVLAGVENSNDGDVSGVHGFGDGWVIKVSNTGNILWEQTYGSTSDDQFFSISPSPDNGFVLSGISRGNDGNVAENHGYYDEWIIKIDNAGALKWTQSSGGNGDDFSLGIVYKNDNEIRSVGRTDSNNYGTPGLHGDRDGYISSLQDR